MGGIPIKIQEGYYWRRKLNKFDAAPAWFTIVSLLIGVGAFLAWPLVVAAVLLLTAIYLVAVPVDMVLDLVFWMCFMLKKGVLAFVSKTKQTPNVQDLEMV